MSQPLRRIAALAGPAVGLAVFALGGVGLLWATMTEPERGALREALAPVLANRGILLIAWWAAVAALAAWFTHRLYERLMLAPRRLANATRVLVGDPAAPALVPEGSGSLQALAGAINSLADERRALTAEMDRQIDEASRRTAEQRDQLGALMNELDRAVVVCTEDGRILLYNGRALDLAREMGQPGAIGLGRQVHALIDADRIDHALDTLRQRLARAGETGAAPVKFVTASAAGRLIEARLSPVRHGSDEDDTSLTGFVLMLDDITRQHGEQSRLDRELSRLTEASRASIASMQAALEMLDMPDLSPEESAEFLSVVRSEVAAMGDHLGALTAASAQEAVTRWPLQDMLGADLIRAAARRIEADGAGTVATGEGGELWLRVDSFGMVQALAHLAAGVRAALPGAALDLRLTPAGPRAHLDLGWSLPPGATLPDALLRLPGMPIPDAEGELTARVIVERHGGEVWLERGKGEDSRAFFRFLLPLAPAEAGAAQTVWPSRPEFYDFDLFASHAGGQDWDDRKLATLTYTVFDCEMTGLDPAGGDEIIQIGAVRIVNGRILRGETIDQLVDPQRSIPEAGIPIHHITPDMVRGQPTIDVALPQFHAFARDSVLVGHNIAFDMRFLKMKESRTGCVFDHPLLDTLLLSSIVNAGEESHSLEALAARLGVQISGRHTALGDAMATAQVFVRMLSLLDQQGIRTLGAARKASGNSQFARLKY